MTPRRHERCEQHPEQKVRYLAYIRSRIEGHCFVYLGLEIVEPVMLFLLRRHDISNHSKSVIWC